MTGVYFSYAITEIYCIIFAITIWLRLSSSLGTEHEVRQLRNMILSYLGMLITDVFWALSENGTLHIPRLPYTVINAVTVISVACGCYFWFRFIEDRLHFRFADSRLANLLLRLPLLFIISLDLISIFTGWLFFIDEQGHYQSTSLFEIHTAVNYFYLLIPTICAVQRAWKARSRQDRGEYLTYALYMMATLRSPPKNARKSGSLALWNLLKQTEAMMPQRMPIKAFSILPKAAGAVSTPMIVATTPLLSMVLTVR